MSNGIRAHGPWTASETSLHINELELQAAFNTIRTFAARSRDIAIRIHLDNTTAVCYINKGGGTRSKRLTDLAELLIAWCEHRNIAIIAVHVAGKLNVIADEESRSKWDSSDWKLSSKIFLSLHSIWPMDVDLCAASWNAQLQRFVSWGPQPGSWATNCFSLNWSEFAGYPPSI